MRSEDSGVRTQEWGARSKEQGVLDTSYFYRLRPRALGGSNDAGRIVQKLTEARIRRHPSSWGERLGTPSRPKPRHASTGAKLQMPRRGPSKY